MLELEKKRLREVFRKKRLALTQEEIAQRSQEICRNFIKNLLPKIYQKSLDKIFSLYLPAAKEVSSNDIAQFFQKNSIKFSYPKITKKNQPLEFILNSENQILTANKFYPKIFEPTSGKRVFPDFLILPLVAFDLDLSRLGMGGGFFDRTILQLRTQKPEIITIGLAYDFQRAHELLPVENTDQRLDFIVTEKNIFLRS